MYQGYRETLKSDIMKLRTQTGILNYLKSVLWKIDINDDMMILINIFGLQNEYYFWCLKRYLYLKKYVVNFHEINSGFIC